MISRKKFYFRIGIPSPKFLVPSLCIDSILLLTWYVYYHSNNICLIIWTLLHCKNRNLKVFDTKSNQFFVIKLDSRFTVWRSKDFSTTQIYVKSNLAILGAQKLPFGPFQRLWLFKFEHFQHLQIRKFLKN